MGKVTIIGISGKARHGKDTAAEAMEDLGFKKMYFATALKEGCRAIFGFDDDQLYGKAKEIVDPFWGVSPRTVLQQVGTEAMRKNFRQDIWIAALGRTIETYAKDRSRPAIVIPDVRFPDEAEAVKRWGGHMIRVVREGHPGLGGPNGEHPSETALDNWGPWDEVILVQSGQVQTLRNFAKMFALDVMGVGHED